MGSHRGFGGFFQISACTSFDSKVAWRMGSSEVKEREGVGEPAEIELQAGATAPCAQHQKKTAGANFLVVRLIMKCDHIMMLQDRTVYCVMRRMVCVKTASRSTGK